MYLLSSLRNIYIFAFLYPNHHNNNKQLKITIPGHILIQIMAPFRQEKTIFPLLPIRNPNLRVLRRSCFVLFMKTSRPRAAANYFSLLNLNEYTMLPWFRQEKRSE